MTHTSIRFHIIPSLLTSFGIITILSARCEAPWDVGGICPIIAIIGAISHEGRNQASAKQYRSETNILGQKVLKSAQTLHYWLRPIRGVHFGFANFASHFIRVQIFQIDFPLILYL